MRGKLSDETKQIVTSDAPSTKRRNYKLVATLGIFCLGRIYGLPGASLWSPWGGFMVFLGRVYGPLGAGLRPLGESFWSPWGEIVVPLGEVYCPLGENLWSPWGAFVVSLG